MRGDVNCRCGQLSKCYVLFLTNCVPEIAEESRVRKDGYETTHLEDEAGILRNVMSFTIALEQLFFNHGALGSGIYRAAFID